MSPVVRPFAYSRDTTCAVSRALGGLGHRDRFERGVLVPGHLHLDRAHVSDHRLRIRPVPRVPASATFRGGRFIAEMLVEFEAQPSPGSPSGGRRSRSRAQRSCGADRGSAANASVLHSWLQVMRLKARMGDRAAGTVGEDERVGIRCRVGLQMSPEDRGCRRRDGDRPDTSRCLGLAAHA